MIKILLFAATLALHASAFAQVYLPAQTMQFDSTIWRTVEIDSLNVGVDSCAHAWVYSEIIPNLWACGVIHDGALRYRICSKCLRHETQQERLYYSPIPISDYDRLKAKLKKEN